MNNVLFDVIIALIGVLGIVITRYLVPFLKSKISSDDLAKYEYWASVAVRAAEMIWTASGMGVDKKRYVHDFMDKMFNSKKQVLTEEQIDALIEACVKELKIQEK